MGHVRKHLGERSEGMPLAVDRLLFAIEELTEQIEQASSELEDLAKGNEVCERLMSAPGVGPISALRFWAALDDIGRFPSAHAVESYLGLTPGENSSSERKRKTSITKAGAPHVRRTLTQACWSAMRHRPNDPLVLWTKQVADRRGKAIAIIAMTRKLSGILYALWRDGTRYNPQRASTMS